MIPMNSLADKTLLLVQYNDSAPHSQNPNKDVSQSLLKWRCNNKSSPKRFVMYPVV